MATAPTLSSVLDLTRPLIAAGASLHWLNPFDFIDENGYKRGKTPRVNKWSEAPTLDLEGLTREYRNRSNIGIRLGEPSKLHGYYLHIIDLDIRKIELADEAVAKLLELWPAALTFPSVISGSRGASRHIYFLSREPFRKLKLAKSKTSQLVWDDSQKRHISRNDWEIDLMGTGSQAVVPPSLHPDTALPYEWERPLHLDLLEFGIGPIVPVGTVAAWGARVVVPESDDDDLEALWNNSPLDIEADEIDAILAQIPNDAEELDAAGNLIRTGAHYDDYIEVGMALHHQFEGREEGFAKWVAWGSQSSKFDARHARYRWDKSFGDAKNPVRMATLIQKANNNRLKADHDFDVEDSFDLTPPSTALVVRQSTDLSDMLADRSTDLTALLGEPVAPAQHSPPVAPDDWQSLFHRNEDGEVKSTSHNLGLIVRYDKRLIGMLAFNEFMQEIVIRGTPAQVRSKRASAKPTVNLDTPIWGKVEISNGTHFTDSHEHSIRMMIEAPTTQGGYGIKVSDRDLRAAIDAAAHRNAFHPVKDKIEALEWDGIRRMENLFIDYLGADATAYHRETAVKMLVAAVARVYEPGHKFDFVVILEGVQGKRKSTFIETLAYGWFAELEGDLHDRKAMVEKMQGAWILEIPELQGFSKAEVTLIKGLLSARQDKVRMAYGRRATIFKRQCIFMGSTNEGEYLRDPTGARRFWPIACSPEGSIDITRLQREVPQIWAEALVAYRELRRATSEEYLPLYLNEVVSAKQALEMQGSRSQETSEAVLAGQIMAWLDTPLTDDTGFDDLDTDAPKVYRNETCIAQIWIDMLGRPAGVIPQQDTMRIGAALKAMGWNRTSGPVASHEINKKYGKCRVYYR